MTPRSNQSLANHPSCFLRHSVPIELGGDIRDVGGPSVCLACLGNAQMRMLFSENIPRPRANPKRKYLGILRTNRGKAESSETTFCGRVTLSNLLDMSFSKSAARRCRLSRQFSTSTPCKDTPIIMNRYSRIITQPKDHGASQVYISSKLPTELMN